jgi:D-inositol-3-phosphate glycosyltransferase
VYTRADAADLAPTLAIEPGFRVHHVPVGPRASVLKEDLPALIPEFTDAVQAHLEATTGRPDVIHANYWLSGVAGHTLKHRLDVPLVTTFHTLALVKGEASDIEPASRAEAEAAIIGCSDTVLANTWVEAEQLVRLYGADPARIEEAPLGVEHAFFSPGNRAGARAAVGLPLDRPILLFVGRIQPLKGVDLAISTLAELGDPRALLVIVGGPSGVHGQQQLEDLRRLIAQHGLQDQVRFVAPQPHHLLSTYYRAADVCLVPSRSESFGLVALEASACGTPVVAAKVGGLQTIIEHKRTGFLVDSREPAAWAARVGEILSSVDLSAGMGANANARSHRYAWSYTAARLRRLYSDLCSRSLVTCR